MTNKTSKTSSAKLPLCQYAPIEHHQSWWSRLLNWMFNGIRYRRRLRRIAKQREKIATVFTCQAPKLEKEIDYSSYEKVAPSKKIEQGIPFDPIITDEHNITYVDQMYVLRLLEDIAQGESRLKEKNKEHFPRIIGLWSDELIDSWGIRPRRLDTEDEYFGCRFHSMLSYIDESWDESERKMVWHYLKERKTILDNIVLGNHPHVKSSGDYRICTDGKYLWHESLEDFILKYNVRPPAFFVDYILSQLKDKTPKSDR